MKFYVECNETTHKIILYWFDEDYEILTEMMSESWSSTTKIVKLEKKQGQIWNHRPLKLMTENRRNVTVLQQSRFYCWL